MKRITFLISAMLIAVFTFAQHHGMDPEEQEKLMMEREAQRIEAEQQLKETYRDIHFPTKKDIVVDYSKGLTFPGVIELLILSPDDDGSEAIRAALDGYDHINATSFLQADLPDLSLSDLTPYDVILTFNNNQWMSIGGVSEDLVGDLLADYIDQGGLFVENSYVMDWDAWQMGGAYVADGYSAFEQATQDFSGAFSMGTVHEPAHPIMTDVDTFGSDGSTLIQDNAVADGATPIVDFDNGQILIAVKDQVASFNFLAMASGALNYIGDGTTLYNNAVTWLMLNQADPDAPGEPANLTATAGAVGALEVILSWDNPDETVGGDPLTDLDAVHVYRDGDLIHTINNPTIGGSETYTDTGMTESGVYGYAVVGENDEGEGLSATASLFVGEDVPGAPEDVHLSADGNNGLLTWDAPTEGMNGGYFDDSDLTYTIVRFPDDVEVATDISGETFTDTTIPGIGNYYYTVTTSNDMGEGGTAESNAALLGAEGILLYETFDYEVGALPPGWEVVGDFAANWGVWNTSNAGGDAPEMRLNWSPSGVGLGRLVTAPIDVEGYEELRFKFKQYLNNFSSFDGEVAAIDISFDDGDTWDDIWEIVVDENVPAGEYELYFNVPPGETTMHMAFRFDGDSWNINQWYLDDLIIEPVVESDLVGVSVTGNTTPSEGIENMYTVTIQNAGTVTQDNYTVRLMKEGDVEIASVAGDPIEFAEALTYELPWTPADEGPTYIYGYVDFPADEVPGNNTTPPLNVVVQPGDILAVSIGDGEVLDHQPFNFFFRHSVVQTLYFPDEIGMGGGVITGLQYYNNFQSVYEDTDIMIFLGETDVEDMADGWIDPASLDLVYDGEFDFPQDQNDIYMPFDDIYVYGGGTLVVYTVKSYPDWQGGNQFYNTTDAGSSRTRRAQNDTAPYDPYDPDAAGTTNNNFPNITMFFSTAGLGALEGTVTEDGNPLEGVHVQVVGTNITTETDEDGEFMFPYLLADTYDILFSKFGYEDTIVEDVVIDEDETTTITASMDAIPAVTVSGFVGGSDFPNVGLEGATVELMGYDDYEVHTDVDGEFEIEGVYANNVYDIHVSFEGYEPYSDEVSVGDTDMELADIILTEIAYPVSNVVAEEVVDGAMITWDEPAPTTEFRYDDGEVDAQLGFQGTWNSVMGAVHFRNATLHEMTWMLTAEGGPHNTVKVWVLGLDADGKPDRDNVLYTAEDVPNTDNQWTTYEFSSPVDAPDGFFIGLSYNGFLGLAVDDGVGEPWDFVPGTQFGVFNITDPTSAFTDIADWDFEVNYLLRGYGMDLGPAKTGAKHYADTPPVGPAPFTGDFQPDFDAGKPEYTSTVDTDQFLGGKALEEFDIWRFPVEDEDDMDAWTQIATGVEDWEYLDTEWFDLDGGVFKYAVVAVYTNDVLAPPALSNELALGMNVEFTVNVSTNSGDSPEGAEVILANQTGNEDYIYTMTAPADGEVVFPSVWMGTYDLHIMLEGFEDYEAHGIVIDDEGLSHDAELIEDIVEPFGLLVEIEGLDAGEALFSWNNVLGTTLFEDFEDGVMPDGWDQIITNTATDGPIPATWNVNDYVSADFSPFGTYHAGLWWDYGNQDEWLITPEISVGPGYELEFWSAVFLGSVNNDHYYVKISTDGGDSWTELWDASAETGEWNYYDSPFILDLDDYNGHDVHIAFNAVDGPTNDGLWYIWFIDNVSVGPEGERNTIAMSEFQRISKAGNQETTRENPDMIARDGSAFTMPGATTSRAFHGFNVFLNDQMVAEEVMDTEYFFTGLPEGDHTAGVQSVYTTGSSDIVTIDFHIEEGADIETYAITFHVNLDLALEHEILVGFDPEVHHIMMTGEMFGWTEPDPAHDDMVLEWLDADPMIFGVTVHLEAGTYEYKYFSDLIGDGWDGGEWEGGDNRMVEVTGDMEVTDHFGFTDDEVTVIETDLVTVNLYPNPARYLLNIESDAQINHVRMVDMLGQVVYHSSVNSAHHQINVSGLDTGVYFIQLTTKDGVITHRVQVTR